MTSPNALHQDAAWRGEVSPGGGVDIDPGGGENLKGNWPRLIHLDNETEDRLRLWLKAELDAFYLERQDLLKDWRRFQTLYWAAPSETQKDFPFRKAANIVIPLAAIAVEAHFARFMNTLFSVEPFWSIRPKTKEWIEAAKPMEKYLQSEVETADSLKVYEFCSESILELLKLGTAVGKSGYEKLIKKSLRATELGTDESVYSTVRNGATLERVPLGNYIQRFAELDEQSAPIVGETHSFTWGQLKKMAQSGRIDPKQLEKIRNWWQDANSVSGTFEGDSVEQKVQEHANMEPKWTAIFKVRELWCSFDVDRDGWDEEVVVDFHRESGIFLSIRYNWYDDLHRPYRVVSCLNVEGIWAGIGICKQVEQFQNEATAIHRQRLDNATLANMSQMVLRKGMGYGPGEPIFPGKMWFVEDPSRDIREFKLSEVYPSAYANEQSVINYYEQRSGVNEVVLGQAHQGTPGTATGDLTRLAEGNKRFDLIMRNIKRWLGYIGVDIVTNYQLFGNQQTHWLVNGPEEGQWVEQVLNMPSVLIRRGAFIELNVTDSITNKEVEQGQWLQLFQVVSGYYDRSMSYAQIMAEVTSDPTPFLEMAQRALLTSDEALRRLMETYDIPDLDRFSLVSKPTPAQLNGEPTNVANRESPSNGAGDPGQITGQRFAGLIGTPPPSGMG